MPLTQSREGPIERGRRLREEQRLLEKQQREEFYDRNPRSVLPQAGVGEGWNAGSEGHLGQHSPQWAAPQYPLAQEPASGLFGIGSPMPSWLPEMGFEQMRRLSDLYADWSANVDPPGVVRDNWDSRPSRMGSLMADYQARNFPQLGPEAQGGGGIAPRPSSGGYYRPWGSEQMAPIPEDPSQMILSEADWIAAQGGLGGLTR